MRVFLFTLQGNSDIAKQNPREEITGSGVDVVSFTRTLDTLRGVFRAAPRPVDVFPVLREQ